MTGSVPPLVLITRPERDAADLARWVEDQGMRALVEPLLTIRYGRGPEPDLNGVQALLMTSSNGVRAFAKRSRRRDIAVFAVGDATAACARQSGFESVRSAAGDVDGLARLIGRELVADRGALFHPAGTEIAGDLAGMLEYQGFTYRRGVFYRAETAQNLSDTCQRALAERSIAYGVFFSPRTAATFATLAAPIAGPTGLAHATAMCLSDTVAGKIRSLSWRRITVADQPTQAALRDCLRRAADGHDP